MSKNQVAGYTILKPIGKGAFAVVYQAQNQKTKEIVAIKQINTEFGDGPHQDKMLELFSTEIEIMKRMKHQNILDLKDVSYTPEHINMILEYCSQGDLEKYIKKHSLKNRLAEEEAKPIILQLIEAVKILHLNNVVHRDLKLANILINEQMQIKLADFGFAKFLNSDLLESYCGTPITMAPEILKKQDYYDARCDIWSLGVMIYQILFGTPPFQPQKGTVQDLLIAIQTQKIAFPQHIAISSDCKDLLRKMLVENPEKRMTFNELFRHPWTQIQRDILYQSVLQVNQAQHQEFVNNLGYTINCFIKVMNEYINRLITPLKGCVELEGICYKLTNRCKEGFNQIRINIAYSNKFITIETQEKSQSFKYFDFREHVLYFLIDLYEYYVSHKEHKEQLTMIFQNPIQPPLITNILRINYDQYTSGLENEIKKMNIQNSKGQELLNIQEQHSTSRQDDINLIVQLGIERIKY